MEVIQNQRAQGKMAYNNWLKSRQLADEEIHKEAIRERYLQKWESILRQIINV